MIKNYVITLCIDSNECELRIKGIKKSIVKSLVRHGIEIIEISLSNETHQELATNHKHTYGGISGAAI